MKSGAKRRTTSSDYEINTDEGNDQVNFSKQNQEQQSMNEYYDEEDEEFGDEDHSGALDANGGGGAEGGDDYERPKLAEGFYEIETVRRKRIRKGKTQYLIKWRDWPESANTWEPVENLMSCSDFIDAFEKRSGKRGRKRKQSVGPSPQSKKKQEQPPQQHSPSDTYEIPSVKIKIIEEPSPIPSVNNSNFSTGTENNIGATSNDSGSLIGSPQIQEPKMKNDLDITLPELKLSSSRNQENMTEFAIHIQEDRADEGVGNGTKKLDGTGVIRVSPRIGARRRKSGAVKRFTQDSKLVAHNAGCDVVVEDAVKNICALGDGLGSNDVVGFSGNGSITEILKPVNYSTSILNGMEDVSVSFLVRRSDGEEVVVDNKYLKEDNPLLLINFYEQHLRYSPSE